MRVFVTGATGVLGRRTVPLLLVAGHEVTAVARTQDRARSLSDQGASPVTIDLFDADAVRSAVAGHDAVVNLATNIPPASSAMFARAWAVNDRLRAEAAGHLVDAAIATGAGRVIQESITFVYEDGGDAWLDERSPVDVKGPIATSQVAEQHARRLTAAGGAGVVLRFAMLTAPEGSHVRDLVRSARAGLLPLFGADGGYETFVDADDAAAAVVAALAVPAGTYNVAEDDPATNGEHAAALERVVGRTVRRPPAVFGRLPKLDLRARSQRVSNRSLRDVSNWRPAVPRVADAWASIVEAADAQHAGAHA